MPQRGFLVIARCLRLANSTHLTAPSWQMNTDLRANRSPGSYTRQASAYSLMSPQAYLAHRRRARCCCRPAYWMPAINLKVEPRDGLLLPGPTYRSSGIVGNGLRRAACFRLPRDGCKYEWCRRNRQCGDAGSRRRRRLGIRCGCACRFHCRRWCRSQ